MENRQHDTVALNVVQKVLKLDQIGDNFYFQFFSVSVAVAKLITHRSCQVDIGPQGEKQIRNRNTD